MIAVRFNCKIKHVLLITLLESVELMWIRLKEEYTSFYCF